MSVATLDEYSSLELKNENPQHAERTRILDMVSRKAQDQTLTLQETTALYEKFNRTYSAYRSNEPQPVDESWALELLQESEQEDIEKSEEMGSFQTRINGIPHQAKPSLASSNQTAPAPANDTIIVDKSSDDKLVPTLSSQDLRFDLKDNFEPVADTKKRNDAFVTFIIATSILTLASLVGFSVFF